jgi:hypothetical protein
MRQFATEAARKELSGTVPLFWQLCPKTNQNFGRHEGVVLDYALITDTVMLARVKRLAVGDLFKAHIVA